MSGKGVGEPALFFRGKDLVAECIKALCSGLRGDEKKDVIVL